MARKFVYLLAALLAAACTSTSLPEVPREGGLSVGVTDIYGDRETREALQAPESAPAGTTFHVRVFSYGSSSCTRPERVDVEVNARRAEMVPYDHVAPAGSVCTMDLRSFPRDVPLRFDTPGEVVVRLRGRSLYGGWAVTERRITIY